jgi:hypothetical protein
MSEFTVEIRPRVSTDWMPLFTDCFITYRGQRFYSRINYVIQDNPHTRAHLIQQFKDRLRRFPSITQAKEKVNVTGSMDSGDLRIAFRRRGHLAETGAGEEGSAGRAASGAERRGSAQAASAGSAAAGSTATSGASEVSAYNEVLGRVERALNSNIIDFAKSGGPPEPRRPALTLVK